MPPPRILTSTAQASKFDQPLGSSLGFRGFNVKLVGFGLKASPSSALVEPLFVEGRKQSCKAWYRPSVPNLPRGPTKKTHHLDTVPHSSPPLLFRKLTWKPKKSPINTTVPLKRGDMSFHDSLGVCTNSLTPIQYKCTSGGTTS